MSMKPRAFADFEVATHSSIQAECPEPSVVRRVGAGNENLLVVENRMVGGYAGARHSHPHDQVVYVISGHVSVMSAGQSFELHVGESFAVRGGIEHQVTAISDSVVLDVFSPCRYDFLQPARNTDPRPR